MRNVYTDLCLSVQALRRQFEGLRTPLAPATGVAAFVYTHQVANVFRVLTDVRVRHLLADEVGLGKTVQALMILNALRYQRKDLRALIIVPDALVPQWRDEITIRAHSVPIGDETGGEGQQYIRLAWEAQLKKSATERTRRWTLADIDPDKYDILVVDEFHRLRTNLQERIARVADGFEHLLLLTATPSFQDVKRHAQLFTLLEPERSFLAKTRDGTDGGVVEGILNRDRREALSCTPKDLTAAALAHCAYRRVIRTRRADYEGVLPKRKHIPRRTRPLGAEEERQSLMWKYFRRLDDVRLAVDPVRLAKRVVLSPPSLEQRVDFLRRRGHEREGLLERAKPLVHRTQGDSRADALVDLLAEIWTKDSSERVLVAAQDNLTVDYLFDIVRARLPLIGRIGSRVPLVAARVRQGMMTEAVEDLAGFKNETNENFEAFQRGDAQVLFAPEAAQVGLNLQCARILVLYSVPWRPEEVDQWIGRLDRIGNDVAFAPEEEAKTIDIYTIAQKGLVDEKVVTVLQRFHAFERSVNLDGTHLKKVSQTIETAALRPEQANWNAIENATETMAYEDEIKELDSDLRPHLPWNVKWATEVRRRLADLPPAPLALKWSQRFIGGPGSWDRAFEGMLKLLAQTRDYAIRLKKDPYGGMFRSLWYQFGPPGIYGFREVLSKVVFSFGQDPGTERSPKHAHAYITRRGDITSPPRRHVILTFDEQEFRRPLHFVSFGNALHDEIVTGWQPNSAETYSADIYLSGDHPFFGYGESGIYIVRLSVLDPASCLQAATVVERALGAIFEASVRVSSIQSTTLMRPFQRAVRCGIEADIRWVRGTLTAELNIQGLKATHGSWKVATIDEVSGLLNPLIHSSNEVPLAAKWTPSEGSRDRISSILERLRYLDQDAAQKTWSSRFADLKAALAVRREVIRNEAQDAVELAEIKLDKAQIDLGTARTRGIQGPITRARNLSDVAADTVAMTRVYWEQRNAWLEECCTAVQTALPEERLTAVIRVRRLN